LAAGAYAVSGERAAQERASAEVADRFCKRFCKRTLRDVVSALRRCGTGCALPGRGRTKPASNGIYGRHT